MSSWSQERERGFEANAEHSFAFIIRYILHVLASLTVK